MRNLKRALSLALASVMLMGMMVVGTSAKGLDDFGDAAEVVNQDAVAVTSEIGIFDGYEDGEFKPENVVTRAEMAVIICKMLYGADVRVSQFAETSVFTDVPAWAEGYVNLCASLGIVAGVGDNKFDPNATVTTAQAAMMLTKALGYFQSARDFGDSWVLAATAKATELGLYGDLKLTAAAGLTRDNVAEMVFNTLTKAVPVQYNELLGVYYNENQGIIYSLEFNYLQTLGYKNFDLVYKTNEQTMYKRPATTWGFGSYNVNTSASDSSKTDLLTENGGLIASKVRMLDKDEIITIANVPTYVYTEGTKAKDVYKDLGATVCNEKEYTWSAYVNGTEQNAEDYAPVKNSSDEYLYTGEGTVTEIYIDDADQTVDVIEINYYLGQVSKVKSDDDGEYVTLKEISKGSDLDTRTFYVEGYAEDDYVIYTIDENDDEKSVIGEIFTPETVTGEVTRVENEKTGADIDDKIVGYTYLRLSDGTKYVYSEGVGVTPDQQQHMVYELTDANNKAHPTLNTEYNLYLDPTGYVVGFTPAAETVDQYLFIKDADEELEDWIAKAVLADATAPKIDVDKDLVSAPTGTITVPYTDHPATYQNGDVQWIDNTGDTTKTKDLTNIENLIWKYSVGSNGVYELTFIEPNGGTTRDEVQYAMTNAQILNGKAYVTDGDNTFIVDKGTTFVDTMNGKVYTGYDEVPNVENAKLAYVLDNKVAEIVFILGGDIYDINTTFFMLADQTRESLKYDDKDFWAYFNAYVNGEKTTLNVKYKADGKKNVLAAAPTLYEVKKTIDEEYIVEVAEVTEGKYDVVTVGIDAFWIDNDNNPATTGLTEKFDTDGETKFVVVDLDADNNYKIFDGDIRDMDVTVGTGDDEYKSVKVQVVLDDNDQYAKLVYIYRVANGSTSSNVPSLNDDVIVDKVTIDSPYTDIFYHVENGKPTALTTDDIKAILADEGCTYIAKDGSNWSFYYNGMTYTNVQVGTYQVNATNADNATSVGFANSANVNYMMSKLFTGGTEQGYTFGQVLKFNNGTLEVNSDEAAKLLTWTQTQWGSTSVPVKVILPSLPGFVTAPVADTSWNGDHIVWIDLAGTGTAEATLTLSNGCELVLPVLYK